MSEAEVMARRLFAEMVHQWHAWPADIRREKIDLYTRAYHLIPWWRRLWLRFNWFVSASELEIILGSGIMRRAAGAREP